MMTVILTAALSLSASAPQDLPTNQLDQHADVVRQRTLIEGTVTRNRDGSTRRASTPPRDGGEPRAIEQTPERRTACANRARFAAEYGRNHPSVRRLYELCARAGY